MVDTDVWASIRRLPGSLLRGADSDDFRAQLIAITAMVGVPICWGSALFNVVLGSQGWTVAINALAGLLILALVWFGRATGYYQLTYVVAVGILFVVFFPGLFFLGGGNHSGMPIWFAFALAFSAIILEGVALLVVVPLEAVVFVSCLLAAYTWPGLVTPLPSEWAVVFDQLYSILATGLALVVALRLWVRMYERNQDQLTARNAELARIDAARAEFLALVAHELNTPLAVIRTHADEAGLDLERREAGSSRAASDLGVIGVETDRLGRLVSQLLDLGRISEGRLSLDLRPVNLDMLIQQTLQAYSHLLTLHDNTLVVPSRSAAPVVLADRERITQVLVNLLSNASRHTHGGTISVAVTERSGMAQVSVSDTGEGIAPDILEQLGRHTVRTRPDGVRSARDTGLGIGLLISREIAVGHGGDLTFESTPGVGTTVRLTLPLAD